MFREMRRKKQALSLEECEQILYHGTSGVLALAGDDDYPYAVPISYVYDGEKLYFHCATSGHKLDAIRRNPKASFCVIGEDRVIPEKYTTYFKSVIVFGILAIVDKEADKYAAIQKLALKYAPSSSSTSRKKAIENEWESLCILEMKVTHMSGKAALEITQRAK